jgi:hypothetical protein
MLMAAASQQQPARPSRDLVMKVGDSFTESQAPCIFCLKYNGRILGHTGLSCRTAHAPSCTGVASQGCAQGGWSQRQGCR